MRVTEARGKGRAPGLLQRGGCGGRVEREAASGAAADDGTGPRRARAGRAPPRVALLFGRRCTSRRARPRASPPAGRGACTARELSASAAPPAHRSCHAACIACSRAQTSRTAGAGGAGQRERSTQHSTHSARLPCVAAPRTRASGAEQTRARTQPQGRRRRARAARGGGRTGDAVPLSPAVRGRGARNAEFRSFPRS